MSLLIRRFAAISLLLAAAACGSETPYKAWQDPRIHLGCEVPADWTMYGDPGPGKPIGFDLFVHEPSVRVEDQWLGPNLVIHRLSRKSSDLPNPEVFEGYRADVLASSEKAFADRSPNISTAAVAGIPARSFTIDYQLKVPQQKGGNAMVDMKSASVVMEKPEAFYIIEYRSNTREFETFYPVFERAKRTLRFD
jgi:hypothetical protein